MYASLIETSNEIISLISVFNIWLIIFIFILYVTNELGIFVPYLAETVWLLIGYQSFIGSLSIFEVILIWIVAMSGRAAGMFLFYMLIRLNVPWINKLYHKHFNSDLPEKIKTSNILPLRILKRINIHTPYHVAFGRLIGLKIPFSIALGLRKLLKVNICALVLSSIIHDSVYIIIGLAGSSFKLSAPLTILYSISALLVVYGISLIIRCTLKIKVSKITS